MVARGRGKKAAAATEAEAVIPNGNAPQENEAASEVVIAPVKKGRAPRGVKKDVKEEVDDAPPAEIAVEKQAKSAKASAKGSKKGAKGKAAAAVVEEDGVEVSVEVKKEDVLPEIESVVPEKKAPGRKRKVDNSEKVEEADPVVKKVPKVTKTKGAKKETVDSDGIPEDPAAAAISLAVIPPAQTNGTKKSSAGRKRGAPKTEEPEPVAAEPVAEKQNHIDEAEGEEVAAAPPAAKKTSKSKSSKKEPKEDKKSAAPKTKGSRKAQKPVAAEVPKEDVVEEEEVTEHDVLPEDEFVPEVEEEEEQKQPLPPAVVEAPKPKKVVKSKGSRKQVTPPIEQEKPTENNDDTEEPTASEPQESEAESASATASVPDEEQPTKSKAKKTAAAKKEKAPAKASKSSSSSSKRGAAKGKKSSKDEEPQEDQQQQPEKPNDNNVDDKNNKADNLDENEKQDAAADVKASKSKMNGTAKLAPEPAQSKTGRGHKRTAATTTTTATPDETEETEKKPGRGRKRAAEDDETDGSKITKPDAGLFNPTKTEYSSKDFAMDKEFNMKISSWNIAGLRAWLKKDGLTYLEHEQPDILCLQEIKCTPEQLPEEARIPGYHPYWLCMPGGHAGVAVYSKIMPINVEYGIGNAEHDDSGRLITAEYEKFYLLCIYVPNSGRKLVNLDKRMQWEELFRAYVQKLEKVKPVIIAGDMNCSHKEIDLANPKTNTKSAGFTVEEREAMSKLFGLGYVDSFRHFHPDQKGAYTYWTYLGKARSRNVGWRLDYFILSERLVAKAVESLIRPQVLGSDHCPITLFLNI